MRIVDQTYNRLALPGTRHPGRRSATTTSTGSALSAHRFGAASAGRRVGLRRLGFVSACLLGSLCDFPQAAGQTTHPSAPGQASQTKVNSDGWTSSAVCGECHQAIHAVWQHSLHASAWSNGVFQAAYRRSIESFGAKTSRQCLFCHAPTVRHGKDFAVKESITAEGVTCDFCHSVRAVDLTDKTDPVRLEVGKTKYGPLKHAQSPAHEVVNSELHRRSEFCAACHEYRNANGLLVLGTYSEWKQSSYAKRGTQCQDCHMPLVPGRVVALDVKSETGTSVNLHDISGSHDIEKVREAITLELVSYEWLGERVWVNLKATNKGSGHCFPTGMPSHRAVLEVTIRDGAKEVGRREIPFEMVVFDKKGLRLRRDYKILVSGARMSRDTRIKPNESRTLEIPFRDIKATRLVLSAMLYYEYSTETLVTDEQGERIEPVQMKFLIASIQKTMRPL